MFGKLYNHKDIRQIADDFWITPPTPDMLLQRPSTGSSDASTARLVTGGRLCGWAGKGLNHARKMAKRYLMGATRIKGSGGQKMDGKTNGGFLVVFMVVVSMLILALAAVPVMAENTTDVAEAFSGKPMCDDEEHLKSEITGIEAESFDTTLKSTSLSLATTAYTPDRTIGISKESTPIENFINTSTITPHSCWCDLRWSGDGVWSSKSIYSKTEEFVCYVQFKNYLQDCSYIIDFQLYHPPEESIKYDFEDGVIKYDTVQKYTYSYPAPGTGWDPGDYKFCSKVEPRVCEGRVLEECCTFTVLPEPDLVITDIYSDGSTIYYKIKNEGDETAGASNTSLTVDAVFLTSDSVSSLEPGEKRTGSFDCIWNCTNTNDTIKVCADCTGDVAESSESNNCRTEALLCNPPDIWVSSTLSH